MKSHSRRNAQPTPVERSLKACLEGLDPSTRIVVAVSGGPDSMALLDCMVRLHVRVVAAHLDHGLRGAESTEDARFVTAAAEKLCVEAVVERAEVAAEALSARQNLEATARRLRYQFLERVAVERSASFVATGHTASDQAETVLMRLVRGSGVDGLVGIHSLRPLGRVSLIRPLLEVTREQVLEYCQDRDVGFRIDSTNADTSFTRAYTRQELLPRLERVSPGATLNLSRTARQAAQDRAYFEKLVSELMDGWAVAPAAPCSLPVEEVLRLPAALRLRVLREAVRRAQGDLRRLDSAHIHTLDRPLEPGRGGREAVLPYGLRVRREGKVLIVGAPKPESG